MKRETDAARLRPMDALLDANLLLVLLVGRLDPANLGNKKYVREYCPEDYALLSSALSRFGRIVVTPNVVTECSNRMCGNDGHGMFEGEALLLAQLLGDGELIKLEEEYAPSLSAVRRGEYSYLGVSDCALLHLVTKDRVVVTADHKLARAAQRINVASINFNHVRTGALLR